MKLFYEEEWATFSTTPVGVDSISSAILYVESGVSEAHLVIGTLSADRKRTQAVRIATIERKDLPAGMAMPATVMGFIEALGAVKGLLRLDVDGETVFEAEPYGEDDD